MTIIADEITRLNAAARRVYGDDISIVVARAPAFGNRDTCYIVFGTAQADVALDLLRFVRNGKVRQPTSNEFMGTKSVYTIVEEMP